MNAVFFSVREANALRWSYTVQSSTNFCSYWSFPNRNWKLKQILEVMAGKSVPLSCCFQWSSAGSSRDLLLGQELLCPGHVPGANASPLFREFLKWCWENNLPKKGGRIIKIIPLLQQRLVSYCCVSGTLITLLALSGFFKNTFSLDDFAWEGRS